MRLLKKTAIIWHAEFAIQVADDVFVMDVSNSVIRNLTNTPATMDGWPMFSFDNNWVYYSSFETGSYCIYRIKPDGSDKSKLTSSNNDEEDARVCLSKDGKWFIYNKKINTTIEIRQLKDI